MQHLFTTLLICWMSFFSFSSCIYCTSWDEALATPETVRHLDLRAEGLISFPDSLELFPNLISLDLGDNLIDVLDLKELRLPNLERLNLSNNPGLNTMELEGIGEAFPSLKYLNLSNSSIKYVSPDLCTLKQLEELDVSHNALGFLPLEIEQIKGLKYIDISHNELNDPYWMKGLWKIEQLKIDHNPRLNLNQVGMALLYKEQLSYLTLSPEIKFEGVPGIFEKVNVSKLTLDGGSIDNLTSKVCGNKNVKELVIKDINGGDGKRLMSWVNRFKDLEKVSFEEMTIPKPINEIENVSEMHFTNCVISNKDQLRKIKPSILVRAVGTDIRNGEYLGNSKELVTETKVEGRGVRMSDEMKNNELIPILEEEEVVRSFEASTPQKIELAFSQYEIPRGAFLRKDGTVYDGPVEVKIKEYTDPIQNALAGVPMIYRNEGQNNVFASSGMIDFRAYDSEGNELSPNEKNPIQVQIGNLQPSEQTNLYVFNEESNNWEDVGVPEASNYALRKKRILDSLNQLPDENFVSFKSVPIGVFMNYKKSRKDPYVLSFNARGSRKTVTRKKEFGSVEQMSNPDQRLLTKQDWKIDTVITPEIQHLLGRIKKAQKESAAYWKKKGEALNYAPRTITELSIEPNMELDNYKMRFKFRDSIVQLPVYPSFGGSFRKVQAKEKQNWKKYEKTKVVADREREILEKYRKKYIKNQAALVREQRAEFLANNPNFAQQQQEYFRFGLSSFGLVNCDYFSRNRPSEYLVFDSTAVDENGREVKVPADVRHIMLKDNSFVSTTSQNVPVYKNRRSIILFAIGALEVAVVKSWKKIRDGLVKPEIERIPINGLTPDEVKSKILSVGR